MYQIIVNPAARSGRGKKNWEKVKNILDDQSVPYEVHFTEKHGDAAALASELYTKAQSEGILLELVILGGDGTVNEVIQGLPSFDKVALSCIPVGSSNDLARGLGISFVVEEAVMHLLTKPTTLYMDVGVVHFENSLVREGNMTIPDRRYLVSCGIGYDASICKEAMSSYVKNFFNKLGLSKLSYLAICIKQMLSMKPATAELTLDDDDVVISIDKLICLVGMNNFYEGGGFKFAPDANNHDGLIDLLAISNVPKLKLFFLLPTALKGEHLKYEGADLYKAYKCTIRTSTPLWVHTDGEVDTKADYIEMKSLKETIRIVY